MNSKLGFSSLLLRLSSQSQMTENSVDTLTLKTLKKLKLQQGFLSHRKTPHRLNATLKNCSIPTHYQQNSSNQTYGKTSFQKNNTERRT
jgi:hypothetical protein